MYTRFTAGNQHNKSTDLPIPAPPQPPPFPPPTFPPPTFPPPIIPPPPIPPFLQSSYLPDTTFYRHDLQSYNSGPAPYSSNEHRSSEEMRQSLIDRWLKGKEAATSVTKMPNSRIKLYELKQKLNAAFTKVKELENDARTLNVMLKTVTVAEWSQKCNEIDEKKKELLSLFNELKFSKTEVSEIKVKYSRRVKKRERLRRQAVKRKLQNDKDKMNSQNLHFRIDKWQKEMQEVVERTKREQELQQEADAVLWGVRQRKSEARRHFELLTTLEELREARVQRRSATGQTTSSVEIQTFNTVIKRLKSLWTQRLDECQLEEQALRGMLAETDVTQDPVTTYKKLVLQEWLVAIFGRADAFHPAQSLLDVRCNWDQFVVSENAILATTIPPGWVLPCPPSSDQWQALLKHGSA